MAILGIGESKVSKCRKKMIKREGERDREGAAAKRAAIAWGRS